MIALYWAYSNDPNEHVVTHTHAEIDAMLDKIAAMADEDWPAAVQVTDPTAHADRNGVELIVGFHVDRGVVRYAGRDNMGGSVSRNDGPDDGEPIIYMVGIYDNEFPSNSEIPLDVVRRAVHEFAETGVRPVEVPWRAVRGDAWA